MKHFFVSYNRNDREWAEWIAWQLEAQGYTAVIQAWDFRPGGNFVLDMQEAALKAQRTIAVLSPAYLESRFAASEWAAAFARDPTGSKRILLPVRVRECQPTGLLPQIVYIDLVGLDEQNAKERLLQGVKSERAKPFAPPRYPGHVHDIPASRPIFPGPPPSTATAAQTLSRPKPWMLAAMIDKKPQSRHLRDTTRRTGRLAYFLMGYQSEWPGALAYRLALDLTAEDIASFRLPARLRIRISAIEDRDQVRDSLYEGLEGKLHVARDESVPLVNRLRIRLTEEKGPLVFFVKIHTDEEPKDIAAALKALLQAWEELLKPISATVRHYLVLTLDVVEERARWFTFWRARDTFERFARPCRAVLEAGGLTHLSLPTLCSPMRKDVEAWLDDCVERFHQSQAEEVRDDVLAPYNTRYRIPHYELKTHVVRHLEKLSSMST